MKRLLSRRDWKIANFLLLLSGASARFGGGLASVGRTTSPLLLRGGGVATETKPYHLKQQLYLQSRSLALREALIQRGLSALSHRPDETVAQPMDWDCALATADHPKSCLFTFDAEENSKVVAPLDSTKWITLRALNRLRRTDPTKVEPLWHNQYPILSTWMSSSHQYSIYSYMNPAGSLLSWLLDTPGLLALAVLLVTSVALLVTLPVWESLVQMIVTSPALWTNWPQWGRFVHASLPLKLLLGQMALKFVAHNLQRVVGRVRNYLVELECDILEDCLPLTIIEGREEENDMEGLEVSSSEDEEYDEDVDSDED